MPTDPNINEQQWGGVNQRIYSTLLPINTYSFSEGIVYRSGKGCRIHGKQLIYKASSPILAILQTSTLLIVQTANELITFPIQRILLFNTLQANPFGETLQEELGNNLYSNV